MVCSYAALRDGLNGMILCRASLIQSRLCKALESIVGVEGGESLRSLFLPFLLSLVGVRILFCDILFFLFLALILVYHWSIS